MKQRIKKKIEVGTISGRELMRQTAPRQEISFRTGAHMTEKDRPRKVGSPAAEPLARPGRRLRRRGALASRHQSDYLGRTGK